MSEATTVSETARASLVRQEVFRDAAPEFVENKLSHVTALAFAEAANADDPLGVLAGYTNCIYAGITPPMHILILIAEWVQSYLNSQGRLSLDRAFHLAPIRKAGHPVRRQARKAQLGQWGWWIYKFRREARTAGRRLSIEAAAARVITLFNLKESEDTLKKFYIKGRLEQIFDRAVQTVEATEAATRNLKSAGNLSGENVGR